MQGVWVWFLVEELRSHMPERNKKKPWCASWYCERQVCVLWCSCRKCRTASKHKGTPGNPILRHILQSNRPEFLKNSQDTKDKGKWKTVPDRNESDKTGQPNAIYGREWISLKGRDWDNWQIQTGSTGWMGAPCQWLHSAHVRERSG